MITKLNLSSIISKYYLGLNESVKWVTVDGVLTINFMTPTKDVIGSVCYKDFPLENSTLSVYDTKKLLNLVNICNGVLIMELEKIKLSYTKLKISDSNFNLVYALSDPLLIGKVGTVNVPEWDVKADLINENIDNLIKAKSALLGIDNMLVTTNKNPDGDPICEFIFGDELGHNNKITYQIPSTVKEMGIKIPFNSDIFKMILQANKDMDSGKLYLSKGGLLKLEFESENTSSEYFIIRKAETTF